MGVRSEVLLTLAWAVLEQFSRELAHYTVAFYVADEPLVLFSEQKDLVRCIQHMLHFHAATFLGRVPFWVPGLWPAVAWLFGGSAAAQSASANWPLVAEMVNSYVSQGKVANMAATLGWGQLGAEYIGQGNLALGTNAPVDSDSLYRIYSMTKPVTGIATMMCIDDGLISLDQPLAEILPAFANMQVQKEYNGAITPDNLEPAIRPITIRQLLTHTAGLGYPSQPGPLATRLEELGLIAALFTRRDIPGFANLQGVSGLEAFTDGLAAMPLVYQPGVRWSYSYGLDVLGRVIEVVTGKKYDVFLKERIFDPCGMNSTWFQVPQSEAHRLTANYAVQEDGLLEMDGQADSLYLEEPPYPFGGGGLVSSPRDYDRFLQMLIGYGEIDGTRVMSEPAVRLATSDLFPDTLAADGGFSMGPAEFGYGAGGLVGRGQMEGLFGWFGAAGTCGLAHMKWGLRSNLMTQYMPAQIYDVYGEFPAAMMGDAIAQLPTR